MLSVRERGWISRTADTLHYYTYTHIHIRTWPVGHVWETVCYLFWHQGGRVFFSSSSSFSPFIWWDSNGIKRCAWFSVVVQFAGSVNGAKKGSILSTSRASITIWCGRITHGKHTSREAHARRGLAYRPHRLADLPGRGRSYKAKSKPAVCVVVVSIVSTLFYYSHSREWVWTLAEYKVVRTTHLLFPERE